MKVFVSEYVCGGGWPEPEIETCLAAEGRAMLLALLTDLARVPDVEVVSTWDSRLPIEHIDGVEFTRIDSADHELDRFDQHATDADATIVIAPESGGVLADRVARLEDLGVNVVGCDSLACRLFGDKLRTFEFLSNADIATVPTSGLQPEIPFEFPIVVKPKDGAGCIETWRFDSASEFDEWRAGMADRFGEFVTQPWITGPSVSVAVIVSPSRTQREATPLVLPIAGQVITGTRQLSYSGGRVPIRLGKQTQSDIEQLARDVCSAMKPRIRGYIGIDMILSDGGPLIVDVNPRLTTSYLGYRQLTESNLAAWILGRGAEQSPIWKDGEVVFKPDFVGS